MSLRLYVVFKPDDGLTREDSMLRINERFPNTASISDDCINLDGKWPGFLTQSDNYNNVPCFPYWSFYFWCYWDAVLENMDFRRYVMTLCELLGADEWWYIEEASIDLYDELSTGEYENILENSIGIENFEIPSFFPNGEHHFFKDSSQRVKSL